MMLIQNGQDMAEMRIEGKTKIVISDQRDNTLVSIVTKDALTGNDGELNKKLPVAAEKTEQTCNVFQLLGEHEIPTAYVRQSSENSFVAHRCMMIPLECVVRRQPYGSYLKRHPKKKYTERFDPPLVEFFHKHTVILPEKKMLPEELAREEYMNEETGWRETRRGGTFPRDTGRARIPPRSGPRRRYLRDGILAPTCAWLCRIPCPL